jgi:hypothetical protein
MAKVTPTLEGEELRDHETEWEATKKYVAQVDKEVDEIGIRVKMTIMTRSRANKGESFYLRVSIPSEWAGFAAKLLTMYPEASTPAEIYRAIFYAGCKTLYAWRQDVSTKEIDKFHIICEEMEREMYDLQILERGWELLKSLQKELRKKIITQRQWHSRRDKLVNGLKEGTLTALGKDRIKAIVEAITDGMPGDEED